MPERTNSSDEASQLPCSLQTTEVNIESMMPSVLMFSMAALQHRSVERPTKTTRRYRFFSHGEETTRACGIPVCSDKGHRAFVVIIAVVIVAVAAVAYDLGLDRHGDNGVHVGC